MHNVAQAALRLTSESIAPGAHRNGAGTRFGFVPRTCAGCAGPCRCPMRPIRDPARDDPPGRVAGPFDRLGPEGVPGVEVVDELAAGDDAAVVNLELDDDIDV